MEKKDFVSGVSLAAVGFFMLWQSLRLSIWGAGGPEAGFYPLAVALVLASLSISLMLKAVFSPPAAVRGEPLEQRRETNLSRVFGYLALMLLYGVFLTAIGFLITSFLLLFLTQKYIEKQQWTVTILVGSASILISYLLFVHFLQVPLPRGFLGNG